MREHENHYYFCPKMKNSFLRDLQILGFSYRSDPQGNDVIRFVLIDLYQIYCHQMKLIFLVMKWLMYAIEAIDVSWIIFFFDYAVFYSFRPTFFCDF